MAFLFLSAHTCAHTHTTAYTQPEGERLQLNRYWTCLGGCVLSWWRPMILAECLLCILRVQFEHDHKHPDLTYYLDSYRYETTVLCSLSQAKENWHFKIVANKHFVTLSSRLLCCLVNLPLSSHPPLPLRLPIANVHQWLGDEKILSTQKSVVLKIPGC